MYESFYGLKERPFSLLPDPDYLYLSPKHLRALTLLEYGMMNQAGFSVICGDTGAGKTTLIRRLLTELGEDTTVGLITNTHKSFGELLSWVLVAFGIDGEGRSKAQMHHMLIEFLIDQYSQNRRTVLIVDEAQNMTADQLEELRMLSNINADKDQVLQVILAGQPALRETLRKPELMQFAQRIAVDYYLESLNRDETHEYIQHRLEVAGGDPETFTDDACYTVYRYSGGTPRLINLLCDTALVYGFAEQSRVIDTKLVEDVVREQHRNSIVPTFSKPLPDDARPAQPTTQPKPEVVKPQVIQQAQAVTETMINQVAPVVEAVVESVAEHVEVASLTQQAASDYTPSPAVASTAPANVVFASEPVPDAHSSHNEAQSAAASKVTRIKKSVKKTDDNPIVAEPTATEASTQPATAQQPLTARGKASVVRASSNNTAKANPAMQPDNETPSLRAAAQVKAEVKPPAQPAATQAPEPMSAQAQADDRAPFETAETESSAYRDVYPIVHIADEPKRNINLLLAGLLGGMVFALLIGVIAAWLILGNMDTTPTAAIPTTEPLGAPSASLADQERLAAMQRERDELKAAAEDAKRERDVALASAQKQEAIRAAERRANDLMAEQERRYSREMEQIRQRAMDAEIAAAKARERERISAEDAARARAEASRAAAVVSPRVNAQTDEPNATVNSNSKPQASTDNTEFSTNPCNSPSAKFLSTCKK